MKRIVAPKSKLEQAREKVAAAGTIAALRAAVLELERESIAALTLGDASSVRPR